MVLHEKHPILKKVEVETLKMLLLESSVIYLAKGQTLYRQGVHDAFVYIVLFGKLQLKVPEIRTRRSGATSMSGVQI